MHDESQSRQEWSASVCSMVAAELRRGASRGILTTEEARQVTNRFLVLLDQALDLPSFRVNTGSADPWDAAAR
ncbi:MAG TPA: hypothetical protein VGM60_09590 [Pseudonocardia sp.]|jgi:hypothetical protein|uniref:hypothetical protein n=1 Tax=Pseudonocardia sp. TaxID=60912 RepID=UPI002F40C0DB